MLNSSQSFLSILQLLTGGSFVFGMVFVLFSVIYFRRSRTEAFWRYRRQAGQSGFRASILAVFFLAVSGALCATTATITYVEDRDPAQAVVPSATATEFIAPILIVTATPEPSLTPSLTPTATLGEVILEFNLTPEMTEEAAAMSAPAVETATTLPTIVITATPESSPTPPPPVIAASLTLQGIDDVMSDSWQPIQPASSFAATTTRLYFFFSYSNFQLGDVWHQNLLKDGEIIQQSSQQWGKTPPEGTSFFFFGDAAGFEVGNYEMQLTFGAENVLLATVPFTITP